MLLERLFENLALSVEPFAVCEVAPGWRLRMDGLEWVTFHFVLRGEGSLLTGARDRSQPLGPFSLAVVPPRLIHALESRQPVAEETTTHDSVAKVGDLLAFLAGPERDRDLVVACGRIQVTYGGSIGLFDRLREPIVLDFSDSEEMGTIFEHLLEEERNPSPGGHAMMVALMNQCLVLLFRRLGTDPECELAWLAAIDDPQLASVLDLILEQPERPHSLDSLAAQALMSRSTFVQQFTASVGRTPMSFVRDVRLRRGAELLRSSNLSVDTVARRVGFGSRSHFSRAFHAYFGRSPAQFRKWSPEPAEVAGLTSP